MVESLLNVIFFAAEVSMFMGICVFPLDWINKNMNDGGGRMSPGGIPPSGPPTG